MGRTTRGAARIVAWVVAAVVLTAASGAAVETCRPDRGFTPRVTDVPSAFGAITPVYVNAAFFNSENTPLDRIDVDDEASALGPPAIILVLTDSNHLSKVLAKRERTTLLVQKFETYPLEAGQIFGRSGAPLAQGENLRIPEGGALDLDSSTNNVSGPGADLVWSREGRALKVTPAGNAQLKMLLTIPVVAHRMKNRENPDDSIGDAFPGQVLEELYVFSGRRGRPNTMWAPAAIAFFLARVEDCLYTLSGSPFRDRTTPVPVADPQEANLVPWPLADCQQAFRRVNRTYNARGTRGLDLYLWWGMQRAAGYGAGHRKDGPSIGPGAVWMDRLCAEGGVGETPCPKLFAHEAGHFLGLCHACATDLTPPEDRGRCGFCLRVRTCSTENAQQLMRDDRHGAGLTPAEVRTARRQAWERLNGR